MQNDQWKRIAEWLARKYNGQTKAIIKEVYGDGVEDEKKDK